ncbi:hypothetical protein QFC19_007454 [Naganishia cerealis]|uniref:Uncharacterized protein n=1 Tax=Naganishia cerealis TaxID=610337 RepID=A0ACC2VAT5_9TREE|nr:hypothetical protein QFC19_007454 [Naganishia cerealis]
MCDIDKGLQQITDPSVGPSTSQTPPAYLLKTVEDIESVPPLVSSPYPRSPRPVLPAPSPVSASPHYPTPPTHLDPSRQQIYHLHFHHILQPQPVPPCRNENLTESRERNKSAHQTPDKIRSPVATDSRVLTVPLLEKYARNSDKHTIDPPPAYYRSAFQPLQDSQRTLVDVPQPHSLPPVFKSATEILQRARSNGGVLVDPSSADPVQRVVVQEPEKIGERSAFPKQSSQSAARDVPPSTHRATCSLPQPNTTHPTQFSDLERFRGQAGLPKTTKIRAKGSSKMYQHLSSNATASAMLSCGSSPSAFISSPLSELPDMDWSLRAGQEPSNILENDSQRTVTGDAKAAATDIVVLQTLQGQREVPLSADDGEDSYYEQGQLKDHRPEQQRHQGDPFSASSSFTYTATESPKSLSPTAMNGRQNHSQSSKHSARAPYDTIDRPLSSESSSSNHSYTPSTQEEEQFHSDIQNLLDSVTWQPNNEAQQGLKITRAGDELQEDHRPQFSQASDSGIIKGEEYPQDSPMMSAAGTPHSQTRSQLGVQASPMRHASTTPTVQSTGAMSNHSHVQQNHGQNQAHLVPVTQVGDRYVYDPSRSTFSAKDNMLTSNAHANLEASNPVSINQDHSRTVSYDMMGGPKSAMPAFTYQYSHEGSNGNNISASHHNQSRVPLSAAPALGGGNVTFLQLPGGGQQFYSYAANGSPGIVVPTSMLQPTRGYPNTGQNATHFASNQQYTPSASAYHHNTHPATLSDGLPSALLYHSRSAGVEPPSAFQMVVSGSHDFFDQNGAGKARKPSLYHVKSEPMSDGMGEDDDCENEDTVSDYEQDRLRNIRRNQEMMERLGLAGNPTGYPHNRGISRSPSKTIKRKTSSMGLKGTLDHKHRFKSRVPSSMGPIRASNRIASKQHRSVSYAEEDRRGGASDSEEDDGYSDAMEEDEDDWDEDDNRGGPRKHRRNVRRKPSYQQLGRSRAVSGRQSRGYRPTLRDLLDTHPRVREAFPLFYHILTDDMMINNESFPLIGSIPSTCTPVEKARFLKEFYHKGRRCLAQLDAFTARCDKRYDGPGDKWKPLDHDTKIAIRDIRRKGVERCENYKYTRRDILNKAVGKNNWEAIEDGMIVWDVHSENRDPANDLAGSELLSPAASVHESMNRRHVSARHRSGRREDPNDFVKDGKQGLSYAESSVAQPVPYTARSVQQFGVYPNDRSAGYTPQLHTAGWGDSFSQGQMQAPNTWQPGHQNGFNVPSLPYSTVSSGQQMVYTPAEALHMAQQHYHAVTSGNQQSGDQNQQYANFNMNGNEPVMLQQQQQQQQQEQQQQQQQQQSQQHQQQVATPNGSNHNGSLTAASAHEINEQSMGMMHGGIDMDFHMAEASYKSKESS